jgi:signal peptidase I
MNGLVRFVLWVLAILGGICVILYLGLFDVWRLPLYDPQFVASVAPTLAGGDLVLISRHETPSFANLVRCADPDAPDRFVVGRLVGTSGDTVELASETLTINGHHTPFPRACDTSTMVMPNPATGSDETLSCSQEEIGGITHDTLRLSEHPEPAKSSQVQAGKVYLVSDNRHMHLDSRDFQGVDPSTCKHIVFRLWSAGGYGDAQRRLTFIW